MSTVRMTNHCAVFATFVLLAHAGCQADERPPPRGTPSSSSSSSSSSSGNGGEAGSAGQGGDGGRGGAATGGAGGAPPAPVCGDFIVNASEECDDGNTMGGDGCAGDCTIESGEVEPNDVAAQASPYVTNPYFYAKVTSKDVDYVSFSVTTPNATVTARTFDVGDGGCAKGQIDSLVEILAADGTTVLASDDDGGEGACSKAVVPLLAMGNYFVRVSAAPKAGAPTFIYQLRIDQIENICGDNDLTAGEECDDGNVMSGDGCSATCKLEISEVEQNGTVAMANPFVAPWNAVLNPAGDVDVVVVNVPTQSATFTATTTDQGSGACAAKTLDTIVEILAPDGTTVLASGDDIVGNCGSALAMNVAPGMYYVRIKGGSLATYPSSYGLQIILQ